ncbi:RNA-processing protein [uncultured Methanospirillum sp.]|uniref:RNA-processing protein n=1 Tax=uncultured Methanospirillum sp. TaxID=262503 RepID=UPI0029C63627|nr:RNA-processing protein [uncultured Methanospirillum sp.]
MDSKQSDQTGNQQITSHYWYNECKSVEGSDSSDLTQLYSGFIANIANRDKFSILPNWQEAVVKGICKDKDEYYSSLREICMFWSRKELQIYNSSEEVRLIKLMLILRETDQMISRLSEQIIFWLSMGENGYDSSSPVKKGQDSIREVASGSGNDGITLLCRSLVSMKESRAGLVRDISTRSERLLPNSSIIVGPLVAARLLVEAGNLRHLSQMPASKIQVLGARNALFSHLSSGSPPPKHGLIFEHKRIHSASRKIRGRVSRTLAANLAIASRIDYYRGIGDITFLERARLRIEKAGRKS